jgi:hypothetical protein
VAEAGENRAASWSRVLRILNLKVSTQAVRLEKGLEEPETLVKD